jgi:hypothetical protein
LFDLTGASMFMSWIRSMLGPFNAVLDFFSAHPEALTAILVVWAAIYYAGYLQLKHIEAKTRRLVLEESRTRLQAQPGASARELFESVYPRWASEFKSWKYLYIPHRWELWPVRPTETNVRVKLSLSPDWVADLLAKNGITVATAEPQ